MNRPVDELEKLRRYCAELEAENRAYARYVRAKTNHLLEVIGTKELEENELDDQALIKLDPIGIVARSFQQILTNLNQTIDELREAKNELQAIFDATGVGISIIDRNFTIERCNEKQREMLVDQGVTEIVGRHCYAIYCDRKAPTATCPALDSFATGSAAIAREVEKKGRWFQLVTTPFSRDESGSVSRLIEVAMDITEKKNAEDAEKELRLFCQTERRKLATVIENLSEGLLVLDRQERIVSCNAAAEKMTGQPIGRKLNRNLREVCPEFAPLLENRTGSEQGVEIALPRNNAEGLLLSVNAACLVDNVGRPIGRVLTFRDITAEKKRTELYHRAEKLAAIGQLSAGVAHELNTPLGSVLGYARLLLKDNALPDNLRAWVETIIQQTKKSSSIIQGLLRFARQSNHLNRSLETCMLDDVVGRTLSLLTTEVGKRRIRLLSNLNPVSAIIADPQELEQLIINLTMNALQAVGEHGEIRVVTEQSGATVVLRVEDNGPGIPEDVRSRIFDPFFTTKPPGEGTGLGLSLCSGIVSDLGGTLDVAGTEGQGAVFTVTFPAAVAATEAGARND